MTTSMKQMRNKRKQKGGEEDGNVIEEETPIYSTSMIHRSFVLSINDINQHIKETLEQNIRSHFEGKCIVEGYVRPGSSKVVSYSCGLVQGVYIKYNVIFQCQICHPVEGMRLKCVATSITKAGIRGESITESPSPFILFVARDHNFNKANMADIQEKDEFIAEVIGQRFELNDPQINIIANFISIQTKSPAIIDDVSV
jgi:hypothetical protein